MVDRQRPIEIAPYIDQALLDPLATFDQVAQVCAQAEQYHFAAVCLYPTLVRQAVKCLSSKQVKVCAVIGFPTGAHTANVKLYEAQEAAGGGATELDVVTNQGWLKMGRSEDIYREIAQIVEETGQTVKAILETPRLSDSEKKLAAEICMDAGASYLKTCTGWFGGATVADVRFLYEMTQGRVGIKASGGIHTLEQALALVEAGATRLGTSRGVELVKEQTAASS